MNSQPQQSHRRLNATAEDVAKERTYAYVPIKRDGASIFPFARQRNETSMSAPVDPDRPNGLHVTVDRVVYQRLDHAPPDRPHCFVYFITIHNHTKNSVTIKGRKWVVTNTRGEVTALEGDGVVGQFPEISPNDTFTYNSFHLIDTATATAEGSYLGVDTEGRRVIARIPRFTMRVPSAEET